MFNVFCLLTGITVIALITMGILKLDLYHSDFTLFCLSVFSNVFLSFGLGGIFHETIQELKKLKQ